MAASTPRAPSPKQVSSAAAIASAEILAHTVAPALVGVSSFVDGRHIWPEAAALYLPGLGNNRLRRDSGRSLQVLDTLAYLRDYDPDASMATWNFLRLANPGHDVHVEGFDGKPNPAAEARLRRFEMTVWQPGGGGGDTLVDVLNLTMFTTGGAGCEVVLRKDLRRVHDIYPFGAGDVDFRWVSLTDEDGDSLAVQKMFPQRTLPGKDPEPLNPRQVHYLPMDPDTDDPWGRPPMLPALGSLLALTALLDELQQVARIHGYGMRDIVINEATVTALMPESIRSNASASRAFKTEVRLQVEEAIKKLRVTDTFVHYDNLKVNTTAPGNLGIPMDPVIQELKRRVVTALKSLPLLLGQLDGSTSTHATVQWQVYARGIKAMLQRTKRLLEDAYNTVLQVWGEPARAVVTFGPIREVDRAIEAAAEQVEFNLALAKYKAGVYSHEEFSLKVEGKVPSGPAPPTDYDEYRLTALQAGLEIPAFTPVPAYEAPVPVPGADAGLTAETGAVLQGGLVGHRMEGPLPPSSADLADAIAWTPEPGMLVYDPLWFSMLKDLNDPDWWDDDWLWTARLAEEAQKVGVS